MLIIFDCDGVLRNISWQGLYNAYIAIIGYANKNHMEFFSDLDDFKKWFNPDWQKNLKEIGVSNKEDEKEISKIFHAHYDPLINIFPWVPELLKDLSRRHELTLLSSSSSLSVKKSLGGLCGLFSLIICCEDVEKIKPDKEGVDLIVKKLNGTRSETLIIGDTDADILAGKRAGIKTGAVNWGLGNWKGLLSLKPDYEFKRPDDLTLLMFFL